MVAMHSGSGWTYAAWIALLISLSGCSGPYDATVSGLVTLDGRLVPRGTVAYHPTGSGPTAYARIDEDGSYSVHTGREAGLPSGEYQVSVIANEPPAQPETAGGGPPPLGKLIVPLWYHSKTTSGLVFQVQPADNVINLELSSQPPPAFRSRQQR